MCTTIYAMYVKRGNFSNLILYGIMIVCLYLAQRIALFEPSNPALTFPQFRELLLPEYIVVFAVLIGLSVWYALVEWKKGDFKIHIPLIISLSVLFIISIVNIFVVPAKVEYIVPIYKTTGDGYGNIIDTVIVGYKNIVINTNLEQRFLYVFASLATLYLAYLLLFTLPRKIRYVKQIDWIMFLIIGVGAVAIIYSIVFEFEDYQQFFATLTLPVNALPSRISSFLGHKNGYGFAVTLAAFACLYLHHTSHKWWYLVMAFVFAIQNFFTTSKTCMLISLIILPIYYIVIFVLQFKKNIKRSIIIFSSLMAIIIAFATLFIIHAVNNEFWPEFFNMTNKINETYFVKGFDYFNHLSGRQRDYQLAEGLIDGHLAIGLGFGIFNAFMMGCEMLCSPSQLTAWSARTITHMDVTSPIQLTDSPHSFYYQLLGTGGIVLLVVYAILVCYVILAAVKTFKKHKLTVFLSLLFLAATFLHGMSEATALFFVGPHPIGSLLLTIMSAVIILSLYHHDYHPSENRQYVENISQKPVEFTKLEPSIITKSLYFFLTLPTVIICVIGPLLYGVNLTDKLWLFITMIVVGSCYLILPITAHFIFDRKSSFRDFFKNTIFPYLVMLVTLGVIVYGYYLIVGSFTFTLAGILLITVCLFYFGVFSSIVYFKSQAGIISYLLDIAYSIFSKHNQKYIELSNEQDKPTLQEKIFSYLNFKRFKKYETGNN